jgi:DNA-directed RNA polymerase subunit omega
MAAPAVKNPVISPDKACQFCGSLFSPPARHPIRTPKKFFLSENDPSMLPDNVIPFEEARPVSRFPGSPMKSHLLDQASEIVTDPLVLINLVSQRVRQLNSGRSPLIPTRPSMGVADIALTEIIEGKIKLVVKAEA